jgi:hypothetical protein
MRTLLFLILTAVALLSIAHAQSPMPVVVPAITPATAQTSATPAVATPSSQTTLKALQEMKAANNEILKQQEATLQKLDEIEKAANEIRIYTKRG